ncbi:PREDICTED: dual specificity mitogen-activated protein kinase kinase 7-like [Nicrophorus vespilloides]|uniref:mitogen-activated protein kinase kinase n=1 Tax=Nicrophorus vespilloides TaxID=110193 RepID=A0ABM1N4V0_NICVS|nr:PREDICTED: dual specificity mitogen-activated protein kinase kinase 7-like [Nicrophorus vespilloides]
MNASNGSKLNLLFDKFNEMSNSSNNVFKGRSAPPDKLNLNLKSIGERRRQHLSFGHQQSMHNEELDSNDKRLKEIMKGSGKLKIGGRIYDTDIKDLQQIEELGNGTCGHVVKMKHIPSSEIIAVKQMRRTGNTVETKRILMDIEVNESHDCPYIVQCIGCIITEAEVWICMELMAMCFDKLLKRLKQPIPEHILGKVTVATVKALAYLKDNCDIIHRDVKPSNILLDERGNVKLCDFGISGRLVDSMAATRGAGCTAYLAPERIEINPDHPDYDIRADVWSLGITLVELATGVFPYQDCKTDFEVLAKVVDQDPPKLPEDKEFSKEFRSFVECCLIKDQQQRPKYVKLKEEPFYKNYETVDVNVGRWFAAAMHPGEPRRQMKSPQVSQLRKVFHMRQHSEPPPVRNNYLNGATRHEPAAPDAMDGGGGRSGGHISRFTNFITNQATEQPQTSCPFRSSQRWNSPMSQRNYAQPPDTTLPYNSGNTSPIVLQRYFHQQKQQQQAKEAEELAKTDAGRRRIPASYFKHVNSERGGSARSSRHQSPDPPPRYNRGIGDSPLASRRTFLESTSPGLSRRNISPMPPMPPPRRLSESSSVPGSPQHVRAKFRYTPEPHRRHFHCTNRDVS